MRQEVLDALEKKIQELKKVAAPNQIETGMSGSFFRFNYYLQSHEVMTQEEFEECVYDDWLRERHAEIFEEINK